MGRGNLERDVSPVGIAGMAQQDPHLGMLSLQRRVRLHTTVLHVEGVSRPPGVEHYEGSGLLDLSVQRLAGWIVRRESGGRVELESAGTGFQGEPGELRGALPA